MLREAAILALALALTVAAWQDVKTREIDVRIFAAAGVVAIVLMWLSWGNPLYTFSLAVGAILALLTRLLGAGVPGELHSRLKAAPDRIWAEV